MILSFSKNYQL